MSLFHRVLSRWSWSLVIFGFLLAAILISGGFYQNVLKRRDLAHAATTTRPASAEPPKLPELKMERSSLEFQLAALPGKFPLLTNAALARHWSSNANLARRDPQLTKPQRQYVNLLLSLLDDRTHTCWKL